MFKKTSILLINFYQGFISPSMKMVLGVNSVCRFEETCSAYTKRMVLEKGVVKGSGLGFVRLLKCQPISS